MSESKRPPTKNKASNEKRFIKMSLNVQKIIKAWITAGEKGDYLNVTLHLMPDGELDKFGNLGMITQDVPTEVYKKAEAVEKGSGKKIQGNILGNACEFDWGGVNHEGMPGATGGKLRGEDEPIDDLPF